MLNNKLYSQVKKSKKCFNNSRSTRENIGARKKKCSFLTRLDKPYNSPTIKAEDVDKESKKRFNDCFKLLYHDNNLFKNYLSLCESSNYILLKDNASS
jgi:hypothetical protein